MGPKLYLIAAACENMGIGYKNDLPWHLKKEMAYFHRMTNAVSSPGKLNCVLMGRNTWDSIPEKFRPLRNRLNVVLTRREFNPPEGVLHYSSWEQAFNELPASKQFEDVEKIWVIGGSSVYKTAIDSPNCHRIYLTRILKEYNCDVFFPEFSQFTLVKDSNVPEEEQEEDGVKYRFEVYEKVN